MPERVKTNAVGPPLQEWTWGILLLLLGLVPRLAFVTVFPTRPVSDFSALVRFALVFRDISWTAPTWQWDFFNPGLPLLLSLILRVAPASPDTVARLATAVATGLVPLLPYLLWRDVQPRWVRLLAGGLLAVWPGQIAFCGVVAQDNWVLLPTVALGALAVRSLSNGQGYPIAAGLLYAAGGAIRQEMLVVLLPLLLPAALGRKPWRRGLLLAGLAAGLPLLLLACQRREATGRFALTSEHGGTTILGSYIPGATANGWANPVPYIASVEPALLEDLPEMRRRAFRIAFHEARARPLFHAARITAFTLDFAVAGEAANLAWSLLTPDVLPTAVQPRAQALARFADPFLRGEMTLLLALFLAALLLAGRDRAVQVLAAAVVLKIGVHAVTVLQGRFLLPATALQILVIVLAAREVGRLPRRRLIAALAAGGVVAVAVLFAAPRAIALVRARDFDPPRTYRFSLGPRTAGPRLLDCTVGSGRLTHVTPTLAQIETYHADPSPGETATADCAFRAPLPSAPPLVIRLLDPYAPGGLPGRMEQRVWVDGREVLVHDVAAEPGDGWTEIPLAASGPGRTTTIRIEIAALHPDPGMGWGRAAATSFELAYRQETR